MQLNHLNNSMPIIITALERGLHAHVHSICIAYIANYIVTYKLLSYNAAVVSE